MRSASSEFASQSAGESYRAMKELTARMQRHGHGRADLPDPREDPSFLGQTKTVTGIDSISTMDEKRLQSELALEICQKYSSLPSLRLPLSTECERTKILMMLASDCSPSGTNVQKAVGYFTDRTASSMSTRLDALATSNLRKACTPLHEEILEYILTCDTRAAIPFLVKLREDTLRALQWVRSTARDDECLPQLEELDSYLLRLFTLWFSPGMLGTYCICD